MSLQIRTSTARKGLILAATLAIGAGQAHAGLTVDDSLNRYSLYGKSSLTIENGASTSAGGWIGSDTIVSLLGTDTIRSRIATSGTLAIGNGQNWVWDKLQVAGNVTGGSTFQHEILDSAMYVGGSLDIQNVNQFKGGLWISSGPITLPSWASQNSFQGTTFSNTAALSTLTSMTPAGGIPGITWGATPQQNPYHAWTMPDTTFNVSGLAIGTFLAAGSRWSCGMNVGYNLVGAGYCATNDSVLPPGEYGDLTISYGTTLYLGEGVYTFNSVTLQNASAPYPTRLLAVQPNGARTVILVKGAFVNTPSGIKNVIAPEKYQLGYGTDSAHFAGGTMMIYAQSDVLLDVELQLWATLVAPRNKVTLSDRVSLFGQILANKIEVLNSFKGTDGAFIPYYPNRPVVTVANFGWKGTEGPSGFTQNANFILQMNHVNGLPVKVYYHTVVPTRDTVIGGVSYSPASNTATPGPQDYADATGSVTITPTVTKDTIAVAVHGNAVPQPNRYFVLVLDSIQNGTLDSTSMWNGHVAGLALILDDDPAPTFQISGWSAYEGTGPGTKAFKFFLQMVDATSGTPILPANSNGASFTWSTVAGTADSTDYTPVHGAKITWPAGQSSDILYVQVRQDSTYEPNETFSVHIDTFSSVQAFSAKAIRTATDTIVNDDSAATIKVNDVSANEGSPLNFTVSLSSISALPACFDWKTADVTAKSGADYKADSGNVCIPPGTTDTNIQIQTFTDNIYEPDETFNILLHPRSGITLVNSDTIGVGKIINTTPMPGITINDVSVVRSATTSKTLTFTAKLIDATGNAVYSAVNGVFSFKIVPVTAVNGTDYLDTSSTLTFQSMTDSVLSIAVTIPANSRWYANPLQFKLVLTSVSGIDTAVPHSKTVGLGSIYTGVGKPVLHVYDSSVAEGNSGSHNALVFRVALLDSATGNPTTSRDTIPFTWSTLSTGGAYTADPADFTAVPGQAASIAAGQGSTTFQVLLNGNNTYQNNRTLGVQLTGGCGCSNANERLTATGTILDDDLPPRVIIDDQTGYRPQGPLDSAWIFHVTLRDPTTASKLWPSGKTVSIRIRTLDSTAQVGLGDYATYGPLTLTFAPGDTSKTVSVTVHHDLHFAPTLAFKVVLDSISGATFLDSLGVGTILNSNPKPIVQVQGGIWSEGDTAKVSVLLIDPRYNTPTWSRIKTSYNWIATDSTAIHDTDYLPFSVSPDSIRALSTGDTLRYQLVVHNMQLPRRDYRVTVTADTAAVQVTTNTQPNGFVGIINNALSPKIWVSSTTDTEPRPGDTTHFAHFRISLTSPSGLPYTVVIQTSDGTAIQDVNYRGHKDTIVFAPKETTKEVYVRLLNDVTFDTAKTYFLTVISGGGLIDTLGARGVGTIVNSDTLLAGVTPALQNVGKDTLDTLYAYFHIKLSLPANQSVSVKYATQDSSVQTSGLYIPISGTVVFRPGQVDSLLRVVVPPSNLKLTQANFFKLVLDSAKVRLPGKDSTIGYFQKQAVVRLFDATNAARLTIDSVVSPKRDTIVWFKLHLSRPIVTDQTIQFQTIGGTALKDRDFRDTSGSHVLKAGQTLDSIPVHILADNVYFSNPRIFTLFLTDTLDTFIVIRSPNGIGKIVDQTAPPAVSITDAAPVRETQTSYFPLKITVGNADTMRVVWHTVAGSAKPGTNYVGHPSDTLIIPPRSISRIIEVVTLDDGVYDTTLHFQVRIDMVLGGNGQVGSPRIGTGAIFDGGALPAVKFATTDTSVREDISPDSLWLTVVLTRPMGYSVTVPVRIDTAASTAKVPKNFELPTTSVTFPAGRDTVRLLVLVHHDSINTDNLVAVFKLAPNRADSIVPNADSTARVTILNVDPPPYIAFRDSLLRIRETDTTIQLPLRLSKISGKTITGTLVVSGGNARVGIDYDLPSGSFTIAPGISTASVALQVHDDHRYGPPRDLWVHFTAMNTSKVLVDPLTSRQGGDTRDTVFHLVITESTARPDLSFSPTQDTAKDINGTADLGVVLSGLSDSVSKAGVVFLDSSKPELRKLHLTLVRDTATVDSAKLSTAVRVTWTNDGMVYDTMRTVHVVLRGSLGAGIGRDSILTLYLTNSNKPPVVLIVIPVDSSHTSQHNVPVDWTVNGVPQPRTDTTLSQGWNTVTKCYTDTAGNTGCNSHHVWADFTPPSVQVFKITGPNTHDSTKDTTWWGDRARTRFGTDTVWYWVRDSIENSNGTWRVKVDTHFVATNFHGDSLFAVPVSACDSTGNCGGDTGWIDLKQSIPAVKILTPPNGSNVVAGYIPVDYQVTDAGKTWQNSGTTLASEPGKLTVTRCYTDDVGNTGCDTHWIQIQPVHVVSSVYVDLNGDGMVDAAIVTLDSRWVGSTLPAFNFTLNDSTRTNQSPNSAHPFYAGPSRGIPKVVNGVTVFWMETGSYMTDSTGKTLMGPDGKPLTNILGDTARLDGVVLRDSLGRVYYKVAGPGKMDSTRLLVPIVPPFAFGMTGFDTAQKAQMIQSWSSKDSGTGKVILYKVVDTFGVGDQVPPVILSAVIHRVENYKDSDTLVIKPSEPIDLSKAGNWLEVWRCGNGKGSCDSSQMAWVKVPADSVHQNKDGSYWFLVPPGDSGSISPNYKVRFSVGVSDALHNTTDTSNIHWATVVTGVARPPLVIVTPPNRIPVIPSSEIDKIYPGTILLKVTKGKSDGTAKTMDWWEPGKGYVGRNQDVIDGCPNEDWCNGPTMEINRPARLIIYIYDLVGTFVTSRSISITQADLNAMQPDQLDRVSIRFDWNHRTNDGHLVATGVYLWRIVSYVQIQGKNAPVLNNQLFKVGVKVQGLNGMF